MPGVQQPVVGREVLGDQPAGPRHGRRDVPAAVDDRPPVWKRMPNGPPPGDEHDVAGRRPKPSSVASAKSPSGTADEEAAAAQPLGGASRGGRLRPRRARPRPEATAGGHEPRGRARRFIGTAPFRRTARRAVPGSATSTAPRRRGAPAARPTDAAGRRHPAPARTRGEQLLRPDLAAERLEVAAARAPPLEVLEALRERHVGAQGREPAVERRVLAPAAERLGQAVPPADRHVPGRGVVGDRLERPVPGQHRARRLLAPARDARDPVGGVAHEGEPVGHRRRRDAELRDDARLVAVRSGEGGRGR